MDSAMYQNQVVKIKLNSKIDKKAPAVLADFSCGKLCDQLEFECYKSVRDSDKEDYTAKRMMIAQGNHFTYSASSKNNPCTHPIRYFVGVRSKTTGKMKLYDSTIFHFKPSIPNALKYMTSIEEATENSYWENRQKLTQEFGSKASKRALSTKFKATVNEDSLEDVVKDNMSENLLENLSNEYQQSSYLPVVNRNATTVDKVFDIDDIISTEEDFALQHLVENWFNDSDSVKTNFSKFASSLINRVSDDPVKLKYLFYYNYLIIFHHLTMADLRKKDPTSLIPEPFKRHFLEKYTSFSKDTSGRQSRIFPSHQKDKLLASILILALRINNYCVNINNFLSDLKRIGLKHFSLIAQTLGCHITTQKVDEDVIKYAEVKLPLNTLPPKYSKKQF